MGFQPRDFSKVKKKGSSSIHYYLSISTLWVSSIRCDNRETDCPPPSPADSFIDAHSLLLPECQYMALPDFSLTPGLYSSCMGELSSRPRRIPPLFSDT